MDDSYTIQISSDLVNKLARDGLGQKKRVKKSKPKVPEVPHRHQSKSSSPPAAPKSGSSGAWPVQAPVFFPVPPPTAPATAAVAELEAIRSVLQQREGVLKKLEQQEANVTLELTQRAKELRDKEFKLPYQKSMPCEAERAACRQCYQENSKQPLKCAQVVRSFDECARRARRRLQPQQVNSKPKIHYSLQTQPGDAMTCTSGWGRTTTQQLGHHLQPVVVLGSTRPFFTASGGARTHCLAIASSWKVIATN